jgi:tetratricopeptide (TPR) repeat protein
MRTLKVEVHGNLYHWNGSAWTDDRFLRPPSKVRSVLMQRLVDQLLRADDGDLDASLVVRAAQACMDEGYLDQAADLTSRVLELDPKHVGAATVLATVMRKQRLPRRAIRVTEPFQRFRNAEVLTVRAAAFADISEWDDAERFIRRAIAIDKAEATPETLQVFARVISARAREAA